MIAALAAAVLTLMLFDGVAMLGDVDEASTLAMNHAAIVVAQMSGAVLASP